MANNIDKTCAELARPAKKYEYKCKELAQLAKNNARVTSAKKMLAPDVFYMESPMLLGSNMAK